MDSSFFYHAWFGRSIDEMALILPKIHHLKSSRVVAVVSIFFQSFWVNKMVQREKWRKGAKNEDLGISRGFGEFIRCRYLLKRHSPHWSGDASKRWGDSLSPLWEEAHVSMKRRRQSDGKGHFILCWQIHCTAHVNFNYQKRVFVMEFSLK